jgi:hypothetical protein
MGLWLNTSKAETRLDKATLWMNLISVQGRISVRVDTMAFLKNHLEIGIHPQEAIEKLHKAYMWV